MASHIHEDLVTRMIAWINSQYGDLQPRIIFDGNGTLGAERPPTIGGFIPDISCTFSSSQMMILGDAKTPNDVESTHSKRQYQSYMEFLNQRGSGMLLVATLWSSQVQARGLLSHMRAKLGAKSVEIKVISDL